ncbi:MAG: acyltransferase [Paraburkholderia fungorum]|nr:acyltransferase [Paraburkholderia fungorum]
MITKENKVSQDQWAILALTRFVLSMLVVIGHISVLVHPYPYLFGVGYLHAGSAVFGFFIISGFSIAASLDSNRPGFYKRRFVRIWPLYATAIAVGLFVEYHFLGNQKFTWPETHVDFAAPMPIDIWATVLMLQNVIGLPLLTIGPIWSLAPEWWHYMVAPIFKRMGTPFLLGWAAISFVAFFAIRPPQGHGAEMLYNGTGILALSWFWMAGFIYYRFRNTTPGLALLLAPAALAMPAGLFVGAPFVFTALILAFSAPMNIGERAKRAFNFLGDVSYPLYLLHMPVLVVATVMGSRHASIMVSGAIALSVASLYLIDYPARKIFSGKRSDAASSTASTA